MMGLPRNLEPLTKAIGLIASLVAVLNTLVPKIIERTFDRRITKVADTLNDLLGKRKASEIIALKADLTVYTDYLDRAIQAGTEELRKLERAQGDRLARRNALPKGWRSWLLLYTPEDFVGAFTHMLFYFSVAFGIFSIVAVILGVWSEHKLGFLWLLPVAIAGFGWWAFVLRNIALQGKEVR